MKYIKKNYITLISLVKDFLIIFIIYNNNFFNIYSNSPNQLIVFCLITFWLLSNYVFGYYSDSNKRLNIISKIFGLLVVTSASNLIYLSINILTEGYEINSKSLIFFINSTLQISFFIFITESIKGYIWAKTKNKKISWLVMTNKTNFLYLKSLLSNSNVNNISLIHFEKNVEESNSNNFDGIIIDNNFIKNDEIYKINFKIKKEINFKTLLHWSNEYLQICPPEFLAENDIFYFKSLNFRNSMQFRLKRLGDIFISFALLILLSPLMLFISIIILFIDGNPIFYSQTRNGYKQKHIKIFKFRSMIKEAEKNGPQWSKANDPRITKLGKIIRKYRIDELPQLISVIKGDMSLIGPRPERPQIDNKLKENIVNYELRNYIKPGISGWAQVNYHYGASLIDSKNKLSYDLYYIKNFSILLDIVILFKTLKIVFNGRGYKPKKSKK